MRILIVEDENLAGEFLEKMINDHLPHCQIVGRAASVKEASRIFYKFKPDLLIMDINLGDHLSFELFEYIDSSDLHVIFTTGYNKYALKAIKVNAIDYLVKPIQEEDLILAINKAKERLQLKENNRFRSFVNKEKDAQGMMLVWEVKSNNLLPIQIGDIIKIRADGSYSRIHMADKRKIQTSKNLGIYDSILQDKGFIRIHHQCLINATHLTSYRPGIRAYVTLSNNDNEFVSKTKKKALMKIMKMPMQRNFE